MPLFTRELNELADYIGRATWTVFLHTAAPTNTNPAITLASRLGAGLMNPGPRSPPGTSRLPLTAISKTAPPSPSARLMRPLGQ